MTEKNLKKWQNIASMIKQEFKENLVQMVLFNYESSETGNLAVILNDDSIEELTETRKIMDKVKHYKLPTPLFLSPDYIKYSLDSFPLEFLNIISDHQSLFCQKDILAGISFEKKYLRLEMERELKGKIILIKTAVLENLGNTKILKELISISIESIETILKGLLFLFDEHIPTNNTELLKKADQVTEFEIDSFQLAVMISKKQAKIQKNELLSFFSKYINQLKTFSEFVEKEMVKKYF